eukprot:gene4322-5048_t
MIIKGYHLITFLVVTTILTVISSAEELKVPHYCDCKDKKTSYFDFSAIRPFDYAQGWHMNWEKDFPMVEVSLEGDSNPLMVGQMISHTSLLNNEKFFSITGKQDLNTLMHASCGGSQSKVTFKFMGGKLTNRFFLIVHGIHPDSDLRIQSYDANKQPVFMNNWDEVDHGFLSPDAMNSQFIEMGKIPGSLSLGFSKTASGSYIVIRPQVEISKIELTLSTKCVPPQCTGTTLFYSLVAVTCKDGEVTPTTPPSDGKFRVKINAFLDANLNEIREPGETALFGDIIKGRIWAPNNPRFQGFDLNLVNPYGAVLDLAPDYYCIFMSDPTKFYLSAQALSQGTEREFHGCFNVTNKDRTIDVSFSYNKIYLNVTPFLDTNSNGIMDANEKIVPGISFVLLNSDIVVFSWDSTDVPFHRELNRASNLCLLTTLPYGTIPLDPQFEGRYCFQAIAGDVNLTIALLPNNRTKHTLTVQTFLDSNANGLRDADEPNVEGTQFLVSIINARVTMGPGTIQLFEDYYCLNFDDPSKRYIPTALSKDSVVSPLNTQHCLELTADTTVQAGVVPYSLGHEVTIATFHDKNKNGILDSDESTADGIEFTLTQLAEVIEIFESKSEPFIKTLYPGPQYCITVQDHPLFAPTKTGGDSVYTPPKYCFTVKNKGLTLLFGFQSHLDG